MRTFEDLTISTPRLLLRPMTESDAPALFAVFSDPKVMRYWSSAPWESMQRAHEMIQRDAASMRVGESLRLGIVRKSDDALLGMCTLFAFSATCRRAEIGYALASAAWGQGYMDEALRALLDYGFGALELNRVEADIDPRNEASARSLERLGFEREGLLRERWIVGEEISDTAFYGLLARDWDAIRSRERD